MDAVVLLVVCISCLQKQMREILVDILFHGVLLRNFFLFEHREAAGIIIDGFLENRV